MHFSIGCQHRDILIIILLLSVSELASIGLVAVNKGYFQVGVEFLRAARARAANHPHDAHHQESVDGFRESFSPQRLDTLLTTAVKVVSWVTV